MLVSETFLHVNCRDFVKFMGKDRNGLDCNVLRFVAQLDTTRPIDLDRRFIIFYYLSDDTISIFEPPMRNSGKRKLSLEVHITFLYRHWEAC